jgi:hypothetical protein
MHPIKHRIGWSLAGLLACGAVALPLVAQSEPAEPPASAPPPPPTAMSSTIPPIDTPYIMAALVQLEGTAVSSPDALLYVSRVTYNRLRDEAGASRACDRENLTLEVTTGVGAQAWGIPAGTKVMISQVRGGVPVPATIVAGDEWFVAGNSVFYTPVPCSPPAAAP